MVTSVPSDLQFIGLEVHLIRCALDFDVNVTKCPAKCKHKSLFLTQGFALVLVSFR